MKLVTGNRLVGSASILTEHQISKLEENITLNKFLKKINY